MLLSAARLRVCESLSYIISRQAGAHPLAQATTGLLAYCLLTECA